MSVSISFIFIYIASGTVMNRSSLAVAKGFLPAEIYEKYLS